MAYFGICAKKNVSNARPSCRSVGKINKDDDEAGGGEDQELEPIVHAALPHTVAKKILFLKIEVMLELATLSF